MGADAIRGGGRRREVKKLKKCIYQQWSVSVNGVSIVFEIPRCKRTGFNCLWMDDIDKCTRGTSIKQDEKGGEE